jgi:hypothetical protein
VKPENDLGFKLPTIDNWLDADDVWRAFVRLSENDGAYVPHDADYWIAEVRQPALNATVPKEIRALYEVARSAIIYGFLCYPLLTLGSEQLHRVLEAAARLKADALGCPRQQIKNDVPEIASFDQAIKWLNAKKLIPDGDLDRWATARWFRNHASHPKMQTIQPPSVAVDTLQRTADTINQFYPV